MKIVLWFCRCLLLQHIIASIHALEEIWLPGATGSGPAEVARVWITAFRAQYPEARLTFSSIGSGSSQKALWGEIDCEGNPVEQICSQSEIKETVWGMGDAPIDRKWYTPHANLELQQFPACAGAVAVVYSKEGRDESETGPLRLTFDVLAGMLNQSIAYWDDPAISRLNPGHRLPHEPLAAIVRNYASGQTAILTNALDYHVASWSDEAVGKSPAWPLGNLTDPAEFTRNAQNCIEREANGTLSGGALVAEYQHYHAAGIRDVSLGILRVPYSFGYMDFGYADTLSDFMSPTQLGSNEQNFVSASVESLRKTMGGLADQLDPETLELDLARADTPQGGYPVAGYAYFYLKRNENAYTSCYQAWLLCQFVKWAFTDPQAAVLAENKGWIVPPAEVANMTVDRMDQIMCLDTEVNPPRVISALSYVPPPYRDVAQEEETNLLLIVVVVSVSVVIVAALVFREIAKQRNAQTDVIWKVGKTELQFDSPVTIIGQGSFGQIVLAEYRGTRVAVKRLIPPRSMTDKEKASIPGEKSDDLELGSANTFPYASSQNAIKTRGQKSSSAGTKQGFSSAMDQVLFVREMRILSKIRHPCIATVMGAVLESGSAPMLVMEYMEHGSLYDILHNETMILDGDLILPMLRDVVQGIRFLHTADPQIVHGDLKSKNILVDARFRAKVADFGISAVGSGGTPYWMAPEVLSKTSPNSVESDIYALGIILYEVFARKNPYQDDKDHDKTIRQICDPMVQKRPPVPFGMPEEFQSIMKECLRHDPQGRPDAEELDGRLRRISDNSNIVSGASQFSGLKPKPANVSLFDLFPRNVAEALRDGRKVEPQHKECVTLFFSDVVDFTALSSKLHPHKVANLLDRLYTIFDELSSKFDVYKVETIGDSYMAVTNLVKDQEHDHVKRIALFAMEAVKAANQTPIDPDDASLGNIQLRVGFHSGPVVADVVGKRSPRYCLFGDTVNTASRMESNSLPNRIQCSRKSFTMLRRQCPELELSMRGRIDVKGKESMVTYFIVDSAKNNSLEVKLSSSLSSSSPSNYSTDKGDPDDRSVASSSHGSKKSVRTTHRIAAAASSPAAASCAGLDPPLSTHSTSTHSTHSDFLNFLRESIAEEEEEEEGGQGSFDENDDKFGNSSSWND